MRRLTNTTYVSLDGVTERLQDWHFQYHDAEAEAVAMDDLVASDAVLMGRTTYDGFAVVWPSRTDDYSQRMNAITKYVASSTLARADWNNSHILQGDLVDEITRLKQEPGSDIVSYGFGSVARTLLAAGLLDEIRFWIHPVLAGRADREELLFRESDPVPLDLVSARTLGSGIIVATYRPTGS